ncbi:hypothetical protein BGZ70_006445 [Mortierella alpina]|uniref:WIBG Mago-binding domain-containing protein n=1 Tax=Mortierella alpina TaxID=64518 RepID=A0A9P6M3R6_MORAP|nr:hypothetical protein BGZ70_006445 [Mortierella alpina]
MSSSSTPAKSIAGIQEDKDVRVIPMTRRPDGTYRKERKVRPGYTPPEDVAKYTNQVLDSIRPAPTPSPLASAASSTPKTKTQLKNDKRKAKRKDEAAAAEAGSATPGFAPKGETATQETESKTVDTPSADPSSTAPATAVDPEKKLRALNKKLRQVEQLKERQDKGETMLPEQLEKITKMDELLAQIAEMSV